MKSLPDQKKLKEFVTTKPVLQEMLKGLVEEEEEKRRTRKRRRNRRKKKEHS